MINIKGKIFLITGATGLIGKSLTRYIIENDGYVIAAIRNIEKANKIFGKNNHIKYIVSDINSIPIKEIEADYIIHAANQTSSRLFVEDPVNTILTSIEGTRRILEIARISRIKGFVYLSSMEVYGTPDDDEKIQEDHDTNINTMVVRSCYPESKRMCESLCTSYLSKYGIPIKVARLSQTFGEGVDYSDERVFAEFSRAVIENKNIILSTKGETKRSYLYIRDAVVAILTILLKGTVGEAYNVANKNTYCSIYEMAKLVAKECANDSIQVIIEEDEAKNKYYTSPLHMNLDTTKVEAIGWKAEVGLAEMYKRMINDMRLGRNINM